MKLSHFITTEMEAILVEWEDFARTLGPVAAEMSVLALRDHAKLLLQAAAKDIEAAQTADEQAEKSKGHAQDEQKSAASEHGKCRQEDGFTMTQMVSEYRALRATVLRLWLRQAKPVTEETTRDMLRFNEAIDQAVAESTARFTRFARKAPSFRAVMDSAAAAGRLAF